MLVWTLLVLVSTQTEGNTQVLGGNSSQFLPQRAVVFGSSTAAGFGATTERKSWAGLLARRLREYNVTVLNRSFPGRNSTDLISLFEEQVVALAPDIVILAPGLANDGFVLSPALSAELHLKNLKTLVEMVKAVGARPIVVGPAPTQRYTHAHAQLIETLYDQFEELQVPIVDFYSSVSKDDGTWRDGLAFDNLHPNERGHSELVTAIPSHYFAATGQEIPAAVFPAAPLFISEDEAGSTAPLDIILDTPLSSWTVCIWHRQAETLTNRSLLGFDTDFARLRNSFARYGYATSFGQLIAPSPNLAEDRLWHHVCVTHRNTDLYTQLYVDGVDMQDRVQMHTVSSDVGRICLFNRCFDRQNSAAIGTAVRSIQVYRVALSQRSLRQLAVSRSVGRSIELRISLGQQAGLLRAAIVSGICTLQFGGGGFSDDQGFGEPKNLLKNQPRRDTPEMF